MTADHSSEQQHIVMVKNPYVRPSVMSVIRCGVLTLSMGVARTHLASESKDKEDETILAGMPVCRGNILPPKIC